MGKKRSKGIWTGLVPVLLFLTASAWLIYYLTGIFNRPAFVRYPAFGIDIPVNYNIHGIDVSRYQQAIDWQDVRSMRVNNIGIGFCFIKATEGLGSIDDRFRRNWYESKKRGLSRGAYHFFNPGRSGKAQALNFIQTVELEKNDLPPVLDVEQINGNDKEEFQQRVKDWLDIVQKKYRVKPIIYTNVNFYEQYLSGKFDAYPLWVAHYYAKGKPAIKREWLFWQHNESGRVNGIATRVDFNVFCGDSAEFKKLLLH